MGFGIGNKVGDKSVTLNDLIRGLDAQKDKKKIERITIAFNYFNKNADGTSKSSLDINEQIAMLNFMHKADGEENDGKVTRRSLNKAQEGVDGALKYKDYKAFMEAYENAIADSNASVKFDARNRTHEGTLVQNGNTSTLYSADETAKELEKTVKGENGTQKFDQFGRLAMKKENGVTTLYKQYDSDKKDAKPTIIDILEPGNQERYTFDTQTGLYRHELGGTFRLSADGKLEAIGYDDHSRIKYEEVGNKQFDYNYYSDDSPMADKISTYDDSIEDGANYYRYDNKHYYRNDVNTNGTHYYTFDPNTHTFTEVDKSAVKPQHTPLPSKVHQTSTWHNKPFDPNPSQKAKELNLDNLDNASEVLDAIIASKEELNGKNIDKEALLKDFIYNNPSVFVHDGDNAGRLFKTVDWQKMDFPHDLSAYITES